MCSRTHFPDLYLRPGAAPAIQHPSGAGDHRRVLHVKGEKVQSVLQHQPKSSPEAGETLSPRRHKLNSVYMPGRFGTPYVSVCISPRINALRDYTGYSYAVVMCGPTSCCSVTQPLALCRLGGRKMARYQHEYRHLSTRQMRLVR